MSGCILSAHHSTTTTAHQGRYEPLTKQGLEGASVAWPGLRIDDIDGDSRSQHPRGPLSNPFNHVADTAVSWEAWISDW